MKLVYSLMLYVLLLCSLLIDIALTTSCRKPPVIDSINNQATFENISSPLLASKISTSYDAKGLQAFFNLANSFMNTVQPKSISEQFQGVNLKELSKDDNKDKILKYETPIFVALGFGLLFVILMPIIGFCFCCCRCCNKCGGAMFQSDKESKKYAKCTIMSLLLLVMTIFMLCGILFMFVTNNRINESAKNISTIYDQAINEAIQFANTTIDQIIQISEDQIPCITYLDKQDLGDDSVKKLIGNPLYQRVLNNLSDTINISYSVSQNIANIYGFLQSIDTLKTPLNEDADDLKNKLKQIKKELDDIANDCINNGSIPKEKCYSINSTVVSTNVDFSSFPDLSEQIETFKSATSFNMTENIKSTAMKIEDIPNTVVNKSKSARLDLIQLVSKTEDQVQEMLYQINGNITNTINTAKSELLTFENNYFKTNSEAFKYENYRYYVYIGISSAVGFIFVLMALGLLFGCCGYKKNVSPTHRSSASNCGGKFLMASVGFMFIFSAILMMFCVVWFAVGMHLHIVCRDVHDGILFDNLLSDKLIIKGKKISVNHLLSQCRSNAPIYKALNVENIYNISKELNIKDKTGDLSSKLNSSSFDLNDLNILSDKFKENLNDLANSNIDTINYAPFFSMINEKVTESNLTLAASNLNNYAKDLSSYNSTAEKLQNISSRLIEIDNTVVLNIKNNLKNLEKNMVALNLTSYHFKETTLDLLKRYIQSDAFIKKEGEYIIKLLISNYATRLIGWLDQGSTHLLVQVQSNMLKCGPIANLYDGVINTYVCSDIVQNVNGFWLALGWCLLFFVPCIILSVKLAKFYRKMNYGSSLDKHAQPPFNESYPMEVRSSVHDHVSLMENNWSHADAPPPYSNNQFTPRYNSGYHY
ncbi:prominin-1-A isoform X2 [Hydra vulgaris]|uniref:Prominin-1-A isoform X2 n=1 Tax=Hydra vulgaris TaxID=6087 RepID=A0ABM4BLJ6_HYDVU